MDRPASDKAPQTPTPGGRGGSPSGAAFRPTEALLRQVRDQGDQEGKSALGELVERHYRYIEHVIRTRRSPLVKAEFDTADCAQNVALEVFQYLPNIEVDGPDGFRRLLRKMIDNTLRDMYARLTAQRRKGTREHVRLGDTKSPLDVADSRAGEPVDLVGGQERNNLLHVALLLLSPEDQELIIRIRFHHENPVVVGKTMDLTRDAVRMRCARAEVRLSAKLHEVHRGDVRGLLRAMHNQRKRLALPETPSEGARAAEL